MYVQNVYIYHFICQIHEIEIIKLGTALRLTNGLDIFDISGFTQNIQKVTHSLYLFSIYKTDNKKFGPYYDITF